MGRKKINLNIQEVAGMFEEGYSQTDIAKKYSVCTAIINRRLRQHYGKKKLCGMFTKNVTETKWPKSKIKPGSIKQWKIAYRILNTTENYSAIAKDFRVSRERVGQIAETLNLAGFKLPTREASSGPARTRGYSSTD